MSMNDPARRGLRNISKQPAKVFVVIPPGDELEVSSDVADQLTAASSAIKPTAAPGEKRAAVKRTARKPSED